MSKEKKMFRENLNCINEKAFKKHILNNKILKREMFGINDCAKLDR